MADHNNPQSRTEEILIATIDGEEYDKLPQSRLEELLLELKEVIEEGGGGGGTTNYNNLSNQPQVNGETLIGNKLGSDLGLVDAEEGKGLSTNDYDDTEKAALADATSAISAIKDGVDIDSFGDVEVALLDKADISDLGTAAAKDSTNSVTSGSTDLVESGAVKDAIDAAVAAAYHHAGTKTVAQLTHDLLVAANEGNVYNITDSGTTTSDFIEGIGKTIDEGSNVGICKVGDVYMFDLLSGFVDTTNFVQKSQTAGLLNNDGTVNTTIEDTVAGHTTAIATKQPITDNSLETTDKTIPGSINELKSGLTNVDVALSVPDGTGKNLLPLTIDNIKAVNTSGIWNNNTYTKNGVSFTLEADDSGSITNIVANGTASGGSARIDLIENFDITNVVGCIYTCLTQAGGIGIFRSAIQQNTDPWVEVARDNGEGGTILSVSGVKNCMIWIAVSSDQTVSNLSFLPMIRMAGTTPDFAPYIPSVESRIEAVEKGKYYGKVNGGSSVTLTLTDNLYILYTWRDADIFTTMTLITKYWGGTPSVQTLYRDSASKVTVTGQVDDKIEIANSGSSSCSYTLKQISFDIQS